MNGWKSVVLVTVVCAGTSLSARGSFVSSSCDLDQPGDAPAAMHGDLADSMIDGALLESDPTPAELAILQSPPATMSPPSAESTRVAFDLSSGANTVAIPLPPALQAGGAMLLSVIGIAGLSQLRRRRLLRRSHPLG